MVKPKKVLFLRARAILPISIPILYVITGYAASAFTLGEFLKRLGSQNRSGTCNPQTRSCFNPQTTYSEWSFKGTTQGSASSNCKGVYERTKKFYANGWQYQTQKAEGPCTERSLRELRDREASQYSDRLENCSRYLREKHFKSVGKYIEQITASLCPSYARTGQKILNDQLQESLAYYKQKFEADQKEEALAAANARQKVNNDYMRNLGWARQARDAINRGAVERAFIFTERGGSSNYVYLHSVVIRSIDAGTTLGGSKVVDANIKTQENGLKPYEKRYRIFCNEARNGSIGVDGLGPGSPYFTQEMGRWLCGRYGIYHP
jgi:hypothetical protein